MDTALIKLQVGRDLEAIDVLQRGANVADAQTAGIDADKLITHAISGSDLS